MKNLKEFMLLFRMKPIEAEPTPIQLQVMHEEWGGFIGQIASQARLVHTTRFGAELKMISKGVQDIQKSDRPEELVLSGSMLIKATSLDEATEIAMNCPVLRAGGSVEIRTTVPMSA